LKDIVTIFYEPLAKVYKAANIADSLSDLQTFLNDLIKTVESAEEGNRALSLSLSCFVFENIALTLWGDD
jgi:hypothetical protein